MQDILCLVVLFELVRGSGYYIGSFFSEKPMRELRLKKGIRHLIFSFSIMNLCFLIDMEKRIENLEKKVVATQARVSPHSLTNRIQIIHHQID